MITWPIAGPDNRYLVAWWDDGPTAPGIRMAWLPRREIPPIMVDPNWPDYPPWQSH